MGMFATSTGGQRGFPPNFPQSAAGAFSFFGTRAAGAPAFGTQPFGAVVPTSGAPRCCRANLRVSASQDSRSPANRAGAGRVREVPRDGVVILPHGIPVREIGRRLPPTDPPRVHVLDGDMHPVFGGEFPHSCRWLVALLVTITSTPSKPKSWATAKASCTLSGYTEALDSATGIWADSSPAAMSARQPR